MHRGRLIERRVLDVLLQPAGRVDAVHVDEARVVVEGVAVDAVGRLLRGEDEDGARLGVGVVCAGCWSRE